MFSFMQAFQGADQLFLVTDFYASLDPQIELQQGKNAIDAAKEVAFHTHACICSYSPLNINYFVAASMHLDASL